MQFALRMFTLMPGTTWNCLSRTDGVFLAGEKKLNLVFFSNLKLSSPVEPMNASCTPGTEKGS